MKASEFLKDKNIIAINDQIKLMVEFVKLKCAEQRVNVGNELVTWTEDLSLPNQRRIHELCQGADEPEF